MLLYLHSVEKNQYKSKRRMIKLTSSSEEYLRNIIEAKDLTDETVLRLWVSKGGCAGMEYQMKLTKAEPDDTVIESNGVKVSVDLDSIPYLEGSTLDYSDNLNDSGFKLLNPNASRSCGCGTSFEPTNNTN